MPQPEYRCPQCKSPRITMLNGTMLCLECGFNEPLDDDVSGYRQTPINEITPIKQTKSQLTRDQWGYVQQMNARVLHLQNKVNELQARKPKQKPMYD